MQWWTCTPIDYTRCLRCCYLFSPTGEKKYHVFGSPESEGKALQRYDSLAGIEDVIPSILSGSSVIKTIRLWTTDHTVVSLNPGPDTLLKALNPQLLTCIRSLWIINPNHNRSGLWVAHAILPNAVNLNLKSKTEDLCVDDLWFWKSTPVHRSLIYRNACCGSFRYFPRLLLKML